MAPNDMRRIADGDIEIQDLSMAATLAMPPSACSANAGHEALRGDDATAAADGDGDAEPFDDDDDDIEATMEVDDLGVDDGPDLDEAELSIEERSSFLDDVRMALCDEANASGARQAVLMCHAAGRVATARRIAIIAPNLMQRMPDIIRDFQLVRDTIGNADPEAVESWIEMPSGHVVIGALVSSWKSPNDPDPYFMMRRFYRGVPEDAPYVATWRGSGMTSDLPLAQVVSLTHVAIGGRSPMPMAARTKLTALKLVALTWAALAYRLEPTIVAGRAPFVVPATEAESGPGMTADA